MSVRILAEIAMPLPTVKTVPAEGLRGVKVYLKNLLEADLEAVRRWKADPALCRAILARPVQLSSAEIRAWHHKNTLDPNQVLMGVYACKTEQAVGLIRLMFIDWASGSAELGIYLGEMGIRGQGLGRETMTLILDFAFGPIGLRRIHLRVGEANIPACRLYESLGFRQEGLLREHFEEDGRYENVVVMGLLAHEYKAHAYKA